MPKQNYTVHPIDKQTFVIEEKTRVMQALCYLLCGEERALLIDTGSGHDDLPQTVRSLTSLPVTVANTHAHLDHIGGNHYFNEQWYHEADREIFKLHTDPKYTLGMLTEGLPRPVRALMGLAAKHILQINTAGNYHYFQDGHIVHLGGRDIEVVPTPGHTPGCVCFLDRQARQLFSGDSVCEWGVLLHFAGEGCPPAVYRDSMQRLKDMENTYDTIWPGHHGFPVEKSFVDEYLTCAQQIVDNTASYKKTKGRDCAYYKRILITVPPVADTVN